MQNNTTFIPKAHSPRTNKETGRRATPRWFYGQQSRFYLVSVQNGAFSSKHYSHDVKSKYREPNGSNLRTEEETINFLIALHKRGGTKNNKCGPGLDSAAFIIKNGCTIQNGLVFAWNPALGWHKPEQYRSQKNTEIRWRLWMPGPNVGQTVILDGNPTHPDFIRFTDEFLASKEAIALRYLDEDTGEINPDFLMCAWLASIAHTKRTQADKARLYFQKKQPNPTLTIDLRNGIVTEQGKGGAWVNPSFFQNL